jgi:predicted nucleotidyltransferase
MADDIDTAAQALSEALGAALGDNLVSLMLYGSAARGTRVAGRSDANVLLVVGDASADALRRAAPALSAWMRVAKAPPLIQTADDWAASADVFPIEVEDIRDAHRLLAGRDVLQGVTTTRANLRLELEREARGKLIRLRAEYAAAAGDGKVLAELLVRALSTFLVFFRAGLRLAGRPLPSSDDQVMRAAAGVAGFDPDALGWALQARERVPAPSLKPFDPVAAGYLRAVEQYVQWIDRLAE